MSNKLSSVTLSTAILLIALAAFGIGTLVAHAGAQQGLFPGDKAPAPEIKALKEIADRARTVCADLPGVKAYSVTAVPDLVNGNVTRPVVEYTCMFTY